MPKLLNSLPKYRRHKASGQAIVTLDGQDFYLGPQSSKTSTPTDWVPIMFKMRSKGCSLQKVADKLNGMGHKTRRGKPWNRMQVSRVLVRSESNQ